ncbi:hypothetical protein LEP1GSC172_4398 [Leptospira noguchii]|uniref:Uncharacterized protein n=1 Tax=Leptospira noguchii TaxID=28182 RepID=M6VAP8_9LEPT|nr:hypothetical protein LEP1GSC172_4405 [Leptospira noguchii]EMO54770.1 hypothetical protein LEP1GSC172_4398 [Leptospira noguchii]
MRKMNFKVIGFKKERRRTKTNILEIRKDLCLVRKFLKRIR